MIVVETKVTPVPVSDRPPPYCDAEEESMHRQITAGALMLSAAIGTAAFGQQAHHPPPQSDGSVTSTLTAEAIRQLLEGDGMGLARAAELNGYPGPKHVLELAQALELSTAQEAKVGVIRQQMLEAARPLGRAIVDAERALDEAFRAGRITEKELSQRTAAIASLQGQLRDAHLRAHLHTRAVLSREQVSRYDGLRRAHH
jgi:Spy/CpxP family protein refolding chaperone